VTRIAFSTAIVAAALMFAATAQAQTTDPKAALFGGYSYMQVARADAGSDGAHGITADYTYFMTRRVGFVMSAAVNWRSIDVGDEFRDEWAVATGAEAHLDLRLSGRVWLRAIQPSALWTNFGNQWQFNWRVAAGFVLRSRGTAR
jgi:hypothetical protein